jgi:hypothetical protein
LTIKTGVIAFSIEVNINFIGTFDDENPWVSILVPDMMVKDSGFLESL